MKIEFERGDVLAIAARPAFRGEVIEVGTKYLTVRDDSLKDQIVLIEDAYEFVRDERGNTGLSLSMSRPPKKRKADTTRSYEFTAQYVPVDGSNRSSMSRSVTMGASDFERATRYFQALPASELQLLDYRLYSVTSRERGDA